jgi:hypothetical protein
MEKLNDIFGLDKFDLFNMIKYDKYAGHTQFLKHDVPFDNKFDGNTDDVADLHKEYRNVHILKNIIATHLGDDVGARMHRHAAKWHDMALHAINYSDHIDDTESWNKTARTHENAIESSIAAHNHDIRNRS